MLTYFTGKKITCNQYLPRWFMLQSLQVASSCIRNLGRVTNEIDLKCLALTYLSGKTCWSWLKFSLSIFDLSVVKLVIQRAALVRKLKRVWLVHFGLKHIQLYYYYNICAVYTAVHSIDKYVVFCPQKSMLSGVYACLDICDKHSINQLRLRLPPGVREVFHMLHNDYTNYYKYTGKV